MTCVVGRVIKGQWVLGGICSENGDLFLTPVDKRDAATLVPIITDNVEVGTTIVTDEWKAYKKLGNHGYIHQTVNHSKNFVSKCNPSYDKHTFFGAMHV